MMKYKHLFTLLFIMLIAQTCFSQDANQLAIEKAKELKQAYALSIQQEDSLNAVLPVYFTAKATFLQLAVKTVSDMKNFQKQHDKILKKFFTTEQYLRNVSVRQLHLQLTGQRLNTTRTNT